MRVSFVCVAFATLLVAHAAKLPFSVRQTMPEDAIGEFKVGQFLGGVCANKIAHTQTVNDEGVIPHSAMSMNGNQCSSPGAMSVFLDPEDALDAVNSEISKRLIQNFIDAGVSAIYGVETSRRMCGFNLSPNTLVIIFKPESNVVVGLDSYIPTRRYMIVDDPVVQGICRYSAPLRDGSTAPAEQTMETMEPTMAPSMAPMAPMAPMPAAGEPSPPAAEPTTPAAEPATEETASEEPGVGGGVVPVGGTDTGSGTDSEGAPDLGDIEGSPEEPSSTPDDDEPVCFPADASVELEDGTTKRMDQLQVGDSVKVGDGQFSPVFLFSHRLRDVTHAFVRMELDNGLALEATHGHYVYANGAMVAAARVQVGDAMQVGGGARATVARVSVVRKRGLFNPQTVHGDVVVNGVRASTFTTAVQSCTASALLAPLRFAFVATGWGGSFLDGGLPAVARMLPAGAAAL